MGVHKVKKAGRFAAKKPALLSDGDSAQSSSETGPQQAQEGWLENDTIELEEPLKATYPPGTEVRVDEASSLQQKDEKKKAEANETQEANETTLMKQDNGNKSQDANATQDANK